MRCFYHRRSRGSYAEDLRSRAFENPQKGFAFYGKPDTQGTPLSNTHTNKNFLIPHRHSPNFGEWALDAESFRRHTVA
jgi:hypothetical protein